MHVDDFIDSTELGEDMQYARWCFTIFRFPAVLKEDFREFIEEYRLFCTYQNVRWRCTGASRLGDIFLTSNLIREIGYEKRVDIAGCSDWSKTPDLNQEPTFHHTTKTGE